ncbi:50S ribosomal protein L35ae [Staphylothermus hellenicus]|uniref:Large ribosomal subunit protein eL33 n=1 Tax=Staphylothermus hellenicus (strain DSM 12710 / JCM 10830 / BK20S6-10-b1 / P8) TaxID=591019 RepID=D7DBV4_STAHD|nr:50S ribosomal protein L35ae [Staphylothermus hellenicus]ADI31651.1 Ribosomal protein L35AE/L33A-like protein [Staphylothermus hellenicus DSM 12710]
MIRVPGLIMSFRRGPRHQYNRQVLIKILDENIPRKSLVGAKVEYVDKYGNKYTGRITRGHGKGWNNVYRAIFYHGLPGQAINSRAFVIKK